MYSIGVTSFLWEDASKVILSHNLALFYIFYLNLIIIFDFQILKYPFYFPFHLIKKPQGTSNTLRFSFT